MDIYEGTLLYGNYDEDAFKLKRIKNIYTETALNEQQLTDLYTYLEKHANDNEGQVISLYDQLLLKLSPDEVKVLLSDLAEILERYPSV